MAKPVISRIFDRLSESWVMSHVPWRYALVVPENRMSVELAAWIRKYFVAASVARG